MKVLKFVVPLLLVLLALGSTESVKAQLAIAFAQDTKTVVAGGLVTFKATLTNTSNASISIDGFNFASLPSDLTWDDAGDLFATSFLGQTISAGNNIEADIFRLQLASSPSNSIPYTYNDSIYVTYNGSALANQLYRVNSQTPTPPVVLVTLLGGIGTVRMTLRRRKKA